MADGVQQVLSELTRVDKNLSGLRSDVGELTTAVARIEERGAAQDRRVSALERWRDERDDAVEATGRHQVRALQKQLAQEIRQHRAEVAGRKRQLVGVGVKVGLLLLGAALASLSPALARALGVG